MARFLSFALGRDARFNPSAAARPPLIDDARMQDRLNRSMRRRMSDDLVNLIRRACFSRHVETATGLLKVLDELMAWENQHFPNCPRAGYETLIRDLAVEIAAARSSTRGAQSPSPLTPHPGGPLESLPLADAAD
jgi:hypothetical protein